MHDMDHEPRDTGRGHRGPLALVVAVVAGIGLLTALAGASSGAPAPAGSADVSITKTDTPDPVSTGGALSYSIRVSNAGPDAATHVVVTDHLPNGVTFVSATASQGSCSPSSNKRRVTCRLGTIGVQVGPNYVPGGGPVYTPGAATISIQVLAPSKAGTITNTATVLSDLKDPKASNNTASASTRVVGPPPKRGPKCGGLHATLIGTPGPDVLRGTPRRDVIVASRGADRIFSDGGRDVICAGGGGDLVRAGGRSDKVFGGRGADRLFGMAGGDSLRGGAGPDRLRGGRGADLLSGGRGDDQCAGGPGRDVFRSC
jgi:uncharacterized repeat protein (TIGR01451 family)